jgi:SAM-dependent methyltransferase
VSTGADFFGRWVDGYDTRYDARNADGHALRARLQVALRLIGEGPGSILDAGMGPGRLCAELAARGWTVSGVDAAPEMVAAAQARLPEAADRLVCAPIEALPFADASFNTVVATGVLEYARLRDALAELARVLRPEGRAVVSYPNPRALYGIWKGRVWYPGIRAAKRALHRGNADFPRGGPTVPPERFSALLAESGLVPERVVHTSYLVFPTPLDTALPRLTVRLGERLEGVGRMPARLLATQVVFEARKRD